jgi:leucyl-tRNA synthetase
VHTQSDGVIRVYTTRPDTLFGVTYLVLSPEHPLVNCLTVPKYRRDVEEYQQKASLKSDLDRTDLNTEKTGVFTGSYAVNPVNGEPVPIWIADYVLSNYGTGAIMAVPAHDDRDFEFARIYGIPIRQVVAPSPGSSLTPKLDSAFTDTGIAVNSGPYDGLPSSEVKARITENLESAGVGRTAVNYRMRDWLFSRQRYWGEPFPIWHELDDAGMPTGLMRPDSQDALPVLHPHLDDFQPSGSPEPMLAKAPAEWLYKTDSDGVRLKRETNSMPQWAGSCWYYLRFCDNRNSKNFISPEKEKYWLPVDLYVGGAEHAVLHLLYSRFWHKVLFDRGYLSTPEPFRKLVNQGMILGEPDENGKAEKMSKSRGNVVNPDDIVREYGADSLRLYEMFMGPLEQTKPWQMSGVEGVFRFLGRVWRMVVDDRSEAVAISAAVADDAPTEEQLRNLHRTIKAVTEDIDRLSFNTAISRMMEFTTFMLAEERRPKAVLQTFVLLLSPFAPHIAEELWQCLGNTNTLALEPWPAFETAYVQETQIEIPVQVNGKIRSRLMLPAAADREMIRQLVHELPAVIAALADKQIVREIIVPGKLVNILTE